MAGEYYAGLGFLIVEVSRHTTLARITDPLPPARFELAIRASERPQTRALDRAATGIGTSYPITVAYISLRIPEYVPHLRHVQFVVFPESKRVYFTLF